MKKLLIIFCVSFLWFSYAYARSRCATSGTATTSNGRTISSEVPDEGPWLPAETSDFNLGGYTIINTGYSEGSVLFADANGDITEDNTNLVFNDTTNVLTATGFTDGTLSIGSGNISAVTTISNSTGINLKPTGDAVDYFNFSTPGSEPTLKAIHANLTLTADQDIIFNPIGGDIWFDGGSTYKITTGGFAYFGPTANMESDTPGSWAFTTLIDSDDVIFLNNIQDTDFIFQGNDGGATETEIFRIDVSDVKVITPGTVQGEQLTSTDDITADDGIIVNNSEDDIQPLTLMGKYGAIGARRGGSIKWMEGGASQGTGTISGYNFVNNNDELVFDTTAQATRADVGNAYIGFDGLANFKNIGIQATPDATEALSLLGATYQSSAITTLHSYNYYNGSGATVVSGYFESRYDGSSNDPQTYGLFGGSHLYNVDPSGTSNTYALEFTAGVGAGVVTQGTHNIYGVSTGIDDAGAQPTGGIFNLYGIKIADTPTNYDGGGATVTYTALDTGDGPVSVGGDLSVTGTATADYFVVTEPTLTDYNIKSGSSGLALGIQNNTSAQAASLELFTKDGDGNDSSYFTMWGTGLPGSITDSEFMVYGYLQSTDSFHIYTAETGTGTLEPLSIYTWGNTDQLKLDTGGEVYMALAVNDALGNLRDTYWDSTSGQIGYDSSTIDNKENIRDLTGSERIYQLQPRLYDRTDRPVTDEAGLIAEEANLIMPEIISYGRDPVYGTMTDPITGEEVQYIESYVTNNEPEAIVNTKLVVYLLKEIQKLEARVTELEKQ